MLKLLYRPPFIGLFPVALIFQLQALGHTHMVLLMRIFGPDSLYWIVGIEGLIGAILVVIGAKIGDEVWATWLGFAGGVQLWNGWVEFAFVYYAHRYVDPNIQANMTKPEYLIMPSSLGIVLAIGMYFLLNRETRCNAFVWIQKHLGLKGGEPTPGYIRNYSTITAIEYVSIAWFFYMVLLLLYDRKFVGDHHPLTYAAFFLFFVWGLYCTQRIVKFTRITGALRYAIPVAAIWWSEIEILGRWKLLKEVWLFPEKHIIEMSLIAGAFITFVAYSLWASRNRLAQQEREALARQGVAAE